MNPRRLALAAVLVPFALSVASPALAWQVKKGNATQLKLDDNGNFGVGVPTPGAKLEVAGQVKITGGNPGAGKVLTSDGNGLASWQAASGGGAGRIVAGWDSDTGVWGGANRFNCPSGTRMLPPTGGRHDGSANFFFCVSQ